MSEDGDRDGVGHGHRDDKQLEVRPAPLEDALPGVPRPVLHHVQLKTKRTDEMIAFQWPNVRKNDRRLPV